MGLEDREVTGAQIGWGLPGFMRIRFLSELNNHERILHRARTLSVIYLKMITLVAVLGKCSRKLSNNPVKSEYGRG